MRSKSYVAVLAKIAADKGGLAKALDMCGDIAEPGLRAEVRDNLLQALVEKRKDEEVLAYLTGPDIDPDFRKQGVNTVLSSWGMSGQKALEWLDAHPGILSAADVLVTLQHAYYNYASSDPSGALKRALTENGEIRQHALQIAYYNLAQTDKAAALAEMAKLSPADAALAKPGYVQALAYKNPTEALAYVEAQDSAAPGHEKLVGSLIEAWVSIDTVAASEWLDKLEPGPARDLGAGSLVRIACQTDPAAGAAWAIQIQDPKLRWQSLSFATSFWKSKPEEARAWVLANSAVLGEKETARLLDRIDL